MSFEWVHIPYAVLTLFIVLNYGLLMTAFMRKIGARVSGRHGIPVWQNYIDIIKTWGQRSQISHGVMFYLGPVFRLSGGIGLLLFVPTIHGSVMHQNFSYAGDLILSLYFVFFGTLGMALGAGESGHPHSAIGISRGLSQTTAAELPLALAVFSISLQYQTLDITRRARPAGDPDRPADRIPLGLPRPDADQPLHLPGRQDGHLHEPLLRRRVELAGICRQGVRDLLRLGLLRRGQPALPRRTEHPLLPEIRAADRPARNPLGVNT